MPAGVGSMSLTGSSSPSRHEKDSEAHQIFRSQPGHQAKAEKHEHVVPGIEHPGSVGVIYVMDRAMASEGTWRVGTATPI